jgi:hypothetical protein
VPALPIQRQRVAGPLAMKAPFYFALTLPWVQALLAHDIRDGRHGHE